MMRFSKSLVCVVALLVVLGGTGVAVADEVSGTIRAISLFEDQFIVTANGRDWVFSMGASGNVYLNDQHVRLHDLRPGDNVNVMYNYDRDNIRLMVQEVRASR
jgi:hypothetical protein